MRDDAVVRTPRVQMLSLTAMGTPVRAPSGRPAARLASTSAARARARSWPTVLNAFRAGFTRSIRASAWRQTSTADTRPAATPSRMLRAVVIAPSAPVHTRHANVSRPLVGVGRVGRGLPWRQRWPRLVGPLRVHEGHHVRGGLHAGRLPGLQLFGQVEDVGELPGEERL